LPGLEEAITPAGDVRTLPSMWAERGGIDGFYVARLTA
jgi:16S rRNA (cytosine967-C5)-methyltransferase